jgi:PleD family two-component response regulator
MILSFDSLCHVNKLGTLTLWGASSTGVDEESNPKIRIFVRGKVLAVEDDLVSRKVVKRMLEKTGFHVITAVDGEKAVSTFQEEFCSIN